MPTIDEINKIKGFQYVVANILEEVDICSKTELYELSAKKYSDKLATDLKKFLEMKLPEVDEEISKSLETIEINGKSFSEVFRQFENDFFDEDGKPKAKA